MNELNVQRVVWIAAAAMNLVETILSTERGDWGFTFIFFALTVAFAWQTVRMFNRDTHKTSHS